MKVRCSPSPAPWEKWKANCLYCPKIPFRRQKTHEKRGVSYAVTISLESALRSQILHSLQDRKGSMGKNASAKRSCHGCLQTSVWFQVHGCSSMQRFCVETAIFKEQKEGRSDSGLSFTLSSRTNSFGNNGSVAATLSSYLCYVGWRVKRGNHRCRQQGH